MQKSWTVFQNYWTIRPPAMYEWSNFSASLPEFGIVSIFNFSLYDRCEVVFLCGLICTSLTTNNTDHLSIRLFPYHIALRWSVCVNLSSSFQLDCFLPAESRGFIVFWIQSFDENVFCKYFHRMTVPSLNSVFCGANIFNFDEI